jgi:beta-galactosidase
LVVTQRTGVKDESNRVVNQRLPGLLAELCGVEVEEYDSLSSQMHNSLEFTLPEIMNGTCPPVRILCDILKPTSAAVLARYTGDYYAGKPAITLNQFGAGRAIYIGAVGDAQLYDPLARWLLDTTGLQNGLAAPPGVEVMQRRHRDKALHFILNHNNTPQTIHLDRPYANLLNRKQVQGDVQLAPLDILILA